jgi:DNA-binding HxlR family transcriptional regulator
MKNINELKHISKVLKAMQSVTAQKVIAVLSNGSDYDFQTKAWLLKLVSCKPSVLSSILKRLIDCGILVKRIRRVVPSKMGSPITEYLLAEPWRGNVFAICDNARVVGRVQKNIVGRSKNSA